MPVATLNRVEADDFSWNVPGLREELVTSLIRSLPKNLRVNFVPAPNKAREFLAAVPPGEEPLLDALERLAAARPTGVVVPREAWDWTKVPEHLRPTYRVVDEDGDEQARGKDLEALKEPLRPQFAAAIAEVATDSGLAAHRRDDVDLRHHRGVVQQPGPATRCAASRRSSTRARPSGCRCSAPRTRQEARHRLGVRRLLLLALASPVKDDPRRPRPTPRSSASPGSPYPTVAELLEDCRAAVVATSSTPARRCATSRRTTRCWPRRARDHEAQLRSVMADVIRVLAAWRRRRAGAQRPRRACACCPR